MRERLWRSAFGCAFDYSQPYEQDKEEIHAKRLSQQVSAEFIPANATLIITVPGALESALKAADAMMRKLPAAPPTRKPWRGRPAFRGGFGPVAQGENDGIALAWPTPRFANVELAVFDVLGHYLVNPVDGAIGIVPVCPPAKRYFSAEVGLFVLQLPPAIPRSPLSAPALSFADSLRAAAPVFQALATLASTAPDPIRLHRARAMALAHLRTNREFWMDEATEYGLAHILGGDVHLAEFEAPNIAEVTAADLQSLARALLRTTPLMHPLVGASEARAASAMRRTKNCLSMYDFKCYVPCETHADSADCSAACGFSLSGDAQIWRMFVAQSPIDEARIRIEFGAPFDPADLAKLLDYSSYHGQLLFPHFPQAFMAHPKAVGLWTIRGTPERLPAMVEQILKLPPSAAPSSVPPTLRIESPMPPEELVASLRAVNINVTAADR